MWHTPLCCVLNLDSWNCCEWVFFIIRWYSKTTFGDKPPNPKKKKLESHSHWTKFYHQNQSYTKSSFPFVDLTTFSVKLLNSSFDSLTLARIRHPTSKVVYRAIFCTIKLTIEESIVAWNAQVESPLQLHRSWGP